MSEHTIFPIHLENISKTYSHKKGKLDVLQSFNMTLDRGETVALIGRSGSGKSTLGRILACMEPPSGGTVKLGNFPETLSKEQQKSVRRKIQVIFQSHTTTLNPMMSIADIVGEGIDIYGIAKGSKRNALIQSLLQDVGLPIECMRRYPHELSGGQKQRVGIARALAVEPECIVCDEPLSALDLCTQEQILELLIGLKKRRQLTYLFITHDIDAVKGFANRKISL